MGQGGPGGHPPSGAGSDATAGVRIADVGQDQLQAPPGGPALYDGSDLNEYRGYSDGMPWFVMARTARLIDQVVATTDRGTEVALTLSPVVEPFGVRFAVAALPDGEGPEHIRAERGGEVVETCRQSTPGGRG